MEPFSRQKFRSTLGARLASVLVDATVKSQRFGAFAAIKISVAGQNLRRVEAGIEGDREEFPVRRCIGVGSQEFPRLGEIFFIHARTKVRQRTACEEKREGQLALPPRKSENFTGRPVSLVNS